MDPSPLVSLPAELLQQIGPHLSNADIASLRSTSIRLAHVFAPFLVDGLALEVSDKILRKKPGVRYNIPFAATPRTLLPFIKRLTIRLDSQIYRASLLDIVREEVTAMASLKYFRLTWSRGPSYFKGEQKVATAGEEEKLLLVVFEGARGCLEHLELNLSFILPMPLHPRLLSSLLLLRKLELYVDEDHNRGILLSVVREILAHSSTLESLSLSMPVHPHEEDHPYAISIPDLFPARRTVSHLPLRSLHLDGAIECQQDLSITDIPSLTYLRHLTILQFGSKDLEAFWNYLRTTKTWVQRLDIEDSITPATIRYLSSFRGVQELFIQHVPKSDHGIFANSMDAIFRFQAASLTKLMITAPVCLWARYEESGHPFYISWPSPCLFAHLTDLLTGSPFKRTFNLETCQDMLAWLEQFPALDHVFIEWAPLYIKTVPDPSLFSRIGSQLVGQTGRPRNWTIQSSYRNQFMWRIQPNSQNQWSFSVHPQGRDHEGNMRWDKYGYWKGHYFS